MTVVINGTTGYSGPVGVLGDLTTTGNTILGDQSTDTLNVANGNLVLDASGDLGLGVTPSAWSGWTGFQIKNAMSLWSANNDLAYYSRNVYYDGSTRRYVFTSAAAEYVQGAGTHTWFIAPSGTAGNAITFTQAMTLNASGNLSLGSASSVARFYVKQSNNTSSSGGVTIENSANDTRLFTYFNVDQDVWVISASYDTNGAYKPLAWYTSDTRRMTLNTAGNLGLGVTPAAWFSSSRAIQIGAAATLSDISGVYTLLGQNYITNAAGADAYLNNGVASLYSQFTGAHRWYNAPSGTAGANMTLTQAMILDASGNLGVGAYGSISPSTYGWDLTNSSFTYLGIFQGANALFFLGSSYTGQPRFQPATDNYYDIGFASGRFKTIYAATGTINTSDANDKQDIDALSDAELRVATAIKSLIKKFRFKDAVVKKGNEARIHVGVMAQDVAAAFVAEGLDPSKYALFCSDTWYAVDGKALDEDARPYTAETEGAVEVTRLGVRYDELLAFVIAAL